MFAHMEHMYIQEKNVRKFLEKENTTLKKFIAQQSNSHKTMLLKLDQLHKKLFSIAKEVEAENRTLKKQLEIKEVETAAHDLLLLKRMDETKKGAI